MSILISVIELTGKRTDVTLADFHKRLLKELQKKFHDGSSVTEAEKTTENFACDEKKKKKRFTFRTCGRIEVQKNTTPSP